MRLGAIAAAIALLGLALAACQRVLHGPAAEPAPVELEWPVDAAPGDRIDAGADAGP